jgi:thiol-disulfide isomerase/thioredoxin
MTCAALAVLLLSWTSGKAIAPIYEQLSQQFPSVAFLKIDIDNADMQPVVNDHGITGVVRRAR